MDVKKIPKGPPFTLFRHYATAQLFHFSSDTRFPQYMCINNFFDNILILAVISEVNCVSLKRFEVQKCCATSETLTLYPDYIAFYQGGGGGSKTSAPFVPARYNGTFDVISEVHFTKEEAEDQNQYAISKF